MGHRTWLATKIVALLAILVAGTLAIVHYASVGQVMADHPEHPAMKVQGETATEAVPPATAISRSPRPALSAPDPPSSTSPPASAAPPPTTSAPDPSPSPSEKELSTPSPGPRPAPIYFHTLPPGAVLPSGAECAHWIRQSPQPEIRPGNYRENHTVGEGVGPRFFPAGDAPQANERLAPRINGHFTGTTEEILRWAACKWGISQSVVFAQAAVESWWRQDMLGDWGTDARDCPPGHKLGVDGSPGLCPRSYGILQNRYPLETASWPAIGRSTAMNADTAYAIWRACYDGDEAWLNSIPRGGRYHRGDLWGCVGRWFAGRWHTARAERYITRVKHYLDERIWLTQRFGHVPTVVIPVAGSRRPVLTIS